MQATIKKESFFRKWECKHFLSLLNSFGSTVKLQFLPKCAIKNAHPDALSFDPLCLYIFAKCTVFENYTKMSHFTTYIYFVFYFFKTKISFFYSSKKVVYMKENPKKWL